MPTPTGPPSELGRQIAGRALLRVRGTSMEPTLREGDVLVVLVRGAPREGDLVVARLPQRPGLAVKRAVRREPGGWWLERDNPREGIDSWVVGVVADQDVLARVAARIWPPRRAARGRRLWND